MKILHVIDTLSMAGAENLLVGLASGQKQIGHEVTVMPLVCPAKTPVREKMEKSGVRVTPIKAKGSLFNPKLIIQIVKVINQYEIVHVHLFPALYWAFIAKVIAFSRVPLIYTEHSTNNRRRNNFLLHFFDGFVYKNGYKMIITCSEKVKETYNKAFPKVKHVYNINNGVNIKLFKEAMPYTKKELLGVDEDTFLVTMVARFMTMKRQDTIVDAITKLPNNVHAVFVGGNANNEGLLRVKDLAKEMNVLDRVHFLYTRNDVPRILKTSDVVIMASDYEGLSLSSIEGMAAGKPFIATNVNGLKEVVGGAGLLFDNNDSEALAGLINKLKTDNIYYDGIAQKCLARAAEYDVDKMVNLYLECYKKIIENLNK